MKFYLAIAFLSLTGSVQKCKKSNAAHIPACVQKKIDSLKAQPMWNPPATVYEYTYKGKTVYAFSADCCDQYNELLDDNCNYLCAPSGGFTGRGDGKCPDFAAEAKQVRLVWRDERDKTQSLKR